MARQRYWIGSTGPYYYDPAKDVPGGGVKQAPVIFEGGIAGAIELDSDGRLVASGKQITAPGVPLTTVQEKGDLIAGTGDETVSRLPVGTPGQYLTPDMGEAGGLKWEDFPSAGNGLIEVFRMDAIDGTATTPELFATVASDRGVFMPLFSVFATEVIDTPTSYPTFSLGTNSTSYNDIVGNTPLGSLTTSDKLRVDIIAAGKILVPAGADIYLRKSTLAVGTTMTYKVLLFGMYLG